MRPRPRNEQNVKHSIKLYRTVVGFSGGGGRLVLIEGRSVAGNSLRVRVCFDAIINCWITNYMLQRGMGRLEAGRGRRTFYCTYVVAAVLPSCWSPFGHWYRSPEVALTRTRPRSGLDSGAGCRPEHNCTKWRSGMRHVACGHARAGGGGWLQLSLRDISSNNKIILCAL